MTTSVSPKQNKQMKRNMIDCKEPCLAVSFRFLTLAHHIYLDTCPVYIFGCFQCSHTSSSFAGEPSQRSWPGVGHGLPGPCGAQMHCEASRHPAHTWHAEVAPASPAVPHRAVTASTEHPCHQTGSAHRDLWLWAA